MGTVSGKEPQMERKRYSRKFQRMAVARMETCENVGELARELGVRPRCLYKWRRKLERVEPGQEVAEAAACDDMSATPSTLLRMALYR